MKNININIKKTIGTILIYLLVLLIFLVPVLFFGQETTTNANYTNLNKFLNGDGTLEKWFMEAFTKLDTRVDAQASAASFFGRAIGSFGALCYLGYLGWQMQEGARPWEVTPMIRPFIIGLILSNWVAFTNLISTPLELLAQPSITMFSSIEEESSNLRVKRFEKQMQILEVLIKQQAEEEAKQEQIEKLEGNSKDEGFISENLSDGLAELTKPIKEWFIRMDFKAQRLIAEILEAVSLAILRTCVYLIFFIQKIWSYVLIILGPIAVGLSLVPGFENSFSSWVSKFININLYTFVSYTIINIGQQLIMTGYQMEIERYNLMIGDGGTLIDEGLLMAYVNSYGMIHTVLFPCVAFLVTGIGVLMTPSIADSIVSGGGAQIMSKAKSAGGTVGSAGKAVGKAAGAAASGGATAVATAAKEIAKSINTMKTK